jgi:hypothetical protein
MHNLTESTATALPLNPNTLDSWREEASMRTLIDATDIKLAYLQLWDMDLLRCCWHCPYCPLSFGSYNQCQSHLIKSHIKFYTICETDL